MASIHKVVQMNGSPDEVFAYLDDVSDMSRHMHGRLTLDMEVLSEHSTGPGATFRFRGKFLWHRVDFTYVVVKWVRNQEKAVSTTSGMKLEMGWRLRPSGEGTELAMDADYELPYGPVGRLLDVLFVRRYFEQCIADWLRHAEHGRSREGTAQPAALKP
jgi:hypothetical protein